MATKSNCTLVDSERGVCLLRTFEGETERLCWDERDTIGVDSYTDTPEFGFWAGAIGDNDCK